MDIFNQGMVLDKTIITGRLKAVRWPLDGRQIGNLWVIILTLKPLIFVIDAIAGDKITVLNLSTI